MSGIPFLDTIAVFSSPLTFAILVGMAAVLMWMAFAPARPEEQVKERLEDYLDREDIVDVYEMERSFFARALSPILRRVLRFFGKLLPQSNVADTERQLRQAGNPGNLTGIDFLGLRLLTALILAGGYFFLAGNNLAFTVALRNALLLGIAGYFVPVWWLRRRIRKRQHEIERALPDVLDMLTISVEAGLAFESAMLRVSNYLDNALTRELKRSVAEMRVGTPRNEALQRMADRSNVPDLRTFVAVLIQSGQMGVSIADVLHTQAEQMRTKRRQRAEELARQAGVKMVFPLVLLIFPALFVIILGPAVPTLNSVLATLGGR